MSVNGWPIRGFPSACVSHIRTLKLFIAGSFTTLYLEAAIQPHAISTFRAPFLKEDCRRAFLDDAPVRALLEIVPVIGFGCQQGKIEAIFL